MNMMLEFIFNFGGKATISSCAAVKYHRACRQRLGPDTETETDTDTDTDRNHGQGQSQRLSQSFGIGHGQGQVVTLPDGFSAPWTATSYTAMPHHTCPYLAGKDKDRHRHRA